MRFSTNHLKGVAAFCAMLFVVASTVSAQVPAETIFPDTTKGFVVIGSLKELADRWKQTQFGQLMQDPIMGPFKEDLRRQLGKRMSDRFGLTLDGIEKLPSGELAVGMIAIPGKTPGFVFTMDVTDRRKETENYLERLTQKLADTGTVRSEEEFEGRKMIVFTFPERGDATRTKVEKPKSKTTPKASEELSPPQRKAYYVLEKNHLVVSDQPYLLKLICDRMENPGKNSLSSVADYQFVKKRCDEDLPKDSPVLIRWYIEPLNYGESIRSLLRGPAVEKRKNKPSIFTVLKEQGFDAIRGVGGVIGLKSEGKEVVHRTFVYAQKPFRLAMRMLTFPDGINFAPPDWMPPEIARCTQVYLDPTAIFDNFGTLFDALVMQGEEGVWDDIIRGLKEEENGPQIDIRNELVVHLGQRAMGMSKYKLPITTTSECIVIAVELKEGKDKEVAKALEKLFGKDTEMMQKKHKSSILWQRVPAEDVIQPFAAPIGAPPIGVPSTGEKATSETSNRRVLISAEDDESQTPPVFPDGAITVAKGCLFAGTNGDYLIEILDRLDAKAASIKNEKEYKEVDLVFTSLGVTEKPHFLQFFARTDETLRPTYEMIRQGKLPQSQAIIAKALNAFAVPADGSAEPVRAQAIDGSKLPEFDKIRKHFGPAGFYGVSEENGFFIKGFLLEKKAEEPTKKAEEKADEPVKKIVEPVKKAEEPAKKTEEKAKKVDEPVKKTEEKADEPVKKVDEKVKKVDEPVKKAEEKAPAKEDEKKKE